MTRAFWDSQMAFSQILPDFQAGLDEMAAQSTAYAQGRAFTQRATGDHPRQWVEWTAGRGPTNILPVVIHGGYWRALEAENHRFLMQGFAAEGAHLANVEYRLMPEVRLADVVADVTAGLRVLAEAHPAAQFLLVGHSAGAHLALSAMGALDLAHRTAGVIALSGVYDLRTVSLCFVQDEIGLSGAEIAAHSLQPQPHWPPVLYVTGGAETFEFQRQSALMASFGRAAWIELGTANHISLTFAAAQASAQLVAQLRAINAPG